MDSIEKAQVEIALENVEAAMTRVLVMMYDNAEIKRFLNDKYPFTTSWDTMVFKFSEYRRLKINELKNDKKWKK